MSDKVHHVHDRSFEHEASANLGLARTPGKNAARKGGVVAHSWGNTEQQIAKENTAHIVTEAVDASSENPLDLMTSSQAGKRLPKPAIHDGMRGHAAISTDGGDQMLAEAVVSGSTKLPATVKES
jgi:hypothetical protein